MIRCRDPASPVRSRRIIKINALRHKFAFSKHPCQISGMERTGSKLFRMAYISTASKLFSSAELREMLKESIKRNKAAGITGMLLYKDGQFMQVLEGTLEVVTATYGRISKDPRHHGIMVLVKGAVQERRFPGWSMAFRDLNLPDHQDVPGFSEFLNTPLTGKEFAGDLEHCEKLLLVFKKSIR